MRVLRTIEEVREFRGTVGEVGFVPTMGALHAGHLHLMKEAVAENEVAIASIFVNPLQFGVNEDLSKYPRQESIDLEKAESVGVSVMFCPDAEEMVGGNATAVSVRGVSDLFEGEKRPGHFDGVATIVAQLFGIVQPNRAYFGLKDLQQCAVVRQMVRDLSMPIVLRLIETVREDNGLAMSSRNEYFSVEDRQRASLIYEMLRKTAHDITSGNMAVEVGLKGGKEQLLNAYFDVEYFELVDPLLMLPVREVAEDSRLIIAARFCGVRLIDNLSVFS